MLEKENAFWNPPNQTENIDELFFTCKWKNKVIFWFNYDFENGTSVL